jgi:hypothetical protein
MTCKLVNSYRALGGEFSHHIQGQAKSVTMGNPEERAASLP